eukprot:3638994-Pleurochrysis_carterae.AAC.1
MNLLEGRPCSLMPFQTRRSRGYPRFSSVPNAQHLLPVTSHGPAIAPAAYALLSAGGSHGEGERAVGSKRRLGLATMKMGTGDREHERARERAREREGKGQGG